MTTEYELKLDLDAASAQAVIAAGLLPGSGDLIDQRATYFDTADNALFAAGFSLRVRKTAAGRVQTLKSGEGTAAGLFVRGEWERPCDNDHPEPDPTWPIPPGIGEATRPLVPVFALATARRRWRVTLDASHVEVAIDACTLTAGPRRAAFTECEIEVLRGSPRDAFRLARRLDRVAPLRLGVQSKAERGYRLRRSDSAAHHAVPTPLGPDIDAALAFQIIATACLRHYRLNEDILLDRPAPEALHQARVALRRLRTAFLLFDHVLHGRRARRLDRAVRRLARTLGAARDLDVIAGLATKGRPPRRIRRQRRRAHRRVRRMLQARTTRRLMIDLAQWIAVGNWQARSGAHRPASQIVAPVLDRLWQRVASRTERFAGLDTAQRHALRRRAKQLRYAATFSAPLFSGTRSSAMIEQLANIQDQLGAMTDRRLLDATLHRLSIDHDRARRRFAILDKGTASDVLPALTDLLAVAPFWRLPAEPPQKFSVENDA